MSKKVIKLLDTVALRADLPARKLRAGEVGTVVEISSLTACMKWNSAMRLARLMPSLPCRNDNSFPYTTGARR